MGAKPSRNEPVYIPKDEPPPRRDEEVYPVLDAIGIGKGMAQGCQRDSRGSPCQLAVPQGVSSSGAKLYREQGSIRRDQCKRYATDLEKVSKNEKAFEEVKKDLIAGTYYEDLGNGYCRQILYDAQEIANVRTPDMLPTDKVRYMTIRKMSDSGGYSAVTKLFVKPAIPFEIEFNGRPHKITVLTLMHPSPIRVENIQHDAMLTLGDSADGNNDGLVVLIPLQGAITAGQSGEFLNKIARYMSGVLQPDPATGDYGTLDIPTGNDWKLSKMFSSTPGQDGKTYVNEPGYYVWMGYPPLELRPSGSPTVVPDKPWYGNMFLRQPDIQKYSWQPKLGAAATRYVMLSKPALVSSMDLQTIRMLPVTPVTEAIAPIFKPSLSYRQAGSPGPNGTWISACAAPPATGVTTNLFSSREGMENPDTCDPFAPGSFPQKDSTDSLIELVIVIFTAISVGLAVYLAVLFFTKTKWGRWVANQGTIAGNKVSQAFVSDSRKIIPVNPLFDTTAAEAEDKAKEEEKIRKEVAEEKRIAKEKAKQGAEAKAKEEAEAAAAKAKEDAAAAKAKEEAAAAKAKEDAEAAAAKAKEDADKARKESLKTYKANRGVRSGPVAEESKTPETPAVDPAAGTGLFTQAEERAVDAVGEEVKAEEDAKRAAEEAEAIRKEKEAAEVKLLEADRAEQKARERAAEEAKDDAAIAAEEATEKPKPRRGNFARTVPAPNVIDARLKAKEAEAKAAAEAKEKADAEAKAAAEAKEKAEADAKAKAEEEEKAKAIADAAEEAAKSASKAAERQTANLAAPIKRRIETSDRNLMDRAEAERKRQADEYAAKQKEADAKKFRPTSGRATAAVPKPEGATPRNPREHPPPTDAELKETTDTLAALTTDAKSGATRLPSAKKTDQSESDAKAKKDKLTKLRDDAFAMMAGVIQSANLNRSLWSRRSVWMRFHEEQKHMKRLNPLVAKLVAFRTEIEGSGLDALQRAGFDTAHATLANKTLRLLAESKRRLDTLEDDASPPIFQGGRRSRMKRKSTRRYVA